MEVCGLLMEKFHWYLVAFTTFVNMLLWPIRQLGRTLTDMGKAVVSIRRIEEILNEPVETLVENNKPEIKEI